MAIELYKTPNKYARAVRLSKLVDGFEVIGYQSYVVGKDYITVNSKKYDIIYPHLNGNLNSKTFLDLGGANGLYSFLANFEGAKPTIVDIDKEHLDIVRTISEEYGFDIDIIEKNVTDIDMKSDVVNALALIHWIYSCTSTFGSLDKAIKFLSDLTNEILIIEWVEPTDGAIQFLKHIKFNEESIEEPYNFDNFIKALEKYFSEVEHIGDVTNTRKLYKCIK